ncbi:hypothetical protein RYH80_03375 [Halobaculum sp. MBLA0147]|uniref:hypothetical protein n=1 Tax=Halobaculum sp. MBLA0147 TaxID=3079934 RepID=UPI0035238A6A
MTDDTDRDRRETRVDEVTDAARTAAGAGWQFCTDWVDRRSRLMQLLLGGAVTLLYEAFAPLVDTAGAVWKLTVATLSPTEALLALLGVQVAQTVLQARKLDTVTDRIGNMGETAVTDGGRETDEDWRTGGGILGGAIAGAGVGSAYGPEGFVAGLVFGTILGDTFEEWVGRSHRSSYDDHTGVEER